MLSLCTDKRIRGLVELMARYGEMIEAFPPVDAGNSRFGNKAFRSWLDRVQLTCAADLESILDCSDDDCVEELSGYLCNSFGNWQRIDYGTGHELHFLCFLCVLCRSSPSTSTLPPDSPSPLLSELALGLFPAYLQLMRQLEMTYWLEPAGSHGVWGLDDYHFVPFLLGSAQLIGHAFLRPSSIHNDELVAEMAADYLYLDAIRFINEIKSFSGNSAVEKDGCAGSRLDSSVNGGLRWHSPMLDDISAVRTWSKVNEGMLRMYRAEVFSKLPIMQHLLFGRTIAFSKSDGNDNGGGGGGGGGGEKGNDDGSTKHPADHVHVAGSVVQGDCCGNPIPSIFAFRSARRPLFPVD